MRRTDQFIATAFAAETDDCIEWPYVRTSGKTGYALAKELGVNKVTVYDILRGRTWVSNTE